MCAIHSEKNESFNVIMNFDSKAHSYESAASIQHDLVKWGTEWMEDTLNGRTVLEMGAGTGTLTRHLVQRTPARLIATDAAPRMLTLGQKACPTADWQLMDAWQPRLSGFDRIYSSSLLQWAPEPEAILRRWRVCLNPGGQLLALLFVEETLPELQQLVPHLRTIVWHSRTKWETYLVKAGFRILRAEAQMQNYAFPSAVTLFKSLHHIGATQPWQLGSRALRQILRLYEERFTTGDAVHSTWTFYRVECLCEEIAG